MVRFRLAWLLTFVGLVAVGLATITQISLRTAVFEIVSNDLESNPNGLVSGSLHCSYSGPDADDRDFFFDVLNVDQPSLLKLQSGKRFRLRFQHDPFWPIEKDNQYLAFIEYCLDVNQNDIDGFVMTPDETRVVLRGR
jgi:hypothetical protein